MSAYPANFNRGARNHTAFALSRKANPSPGESEKERKSVLSPLSFCE